MKRQSIYCTLSFLTVLYGIICSACSLVISSQSSSNKNMIFLLSLVIIVIGLILFYFNRKRYKIIKNLFSHNQNILAHWTFKPTASKLIKTSFMDQKYSDIGALTLVFILFITIGLTLIASRLQYELFMGLIIILGNLMIYIFALKELFHYYAISDTEDTSIIFSEHYFYYLGSLHMLHKSIYLLEDIVIESNDEMTLKFLYGQFNTYEPSTYIIEIPIPENALPTAVSIQKHYLKKMRRIKD